jgi:hypothetical protein
VILISLNSKSGTSFYLNRQRCVNSILNSRTADPPWRAYSGGTGFLGAPRITDSGYNTISSYRLLAYQLALTGGVLEWDAALPLVRTWALASVAV